MRSNNLPKYPASAYGLGAVWSSYPSTGMSESASYMDGGSSLSSAGTYIHTHFLTLTSRGLLTDENTILQLLTSLFSI